MKKVLCFSLMVVLGVVLRAQDAGGDIVSGEKYSYRNGIEVHYSQGVAPRDMWGWTATRDVIDVHQIGIGYDRGLGTRLHLKIDVNMQMSNKYRYSSKWYNKKPVVHSFLMFPVRVGYQYKYMYGDVGLFASYQCDRVDSSPVTVSRMDGWRWAMGAMAELGFRIKVDNNSFVNMGVSGMWSIVRYRERTIDEGMVAKEGDAVRMHVTPEYLITLGFIRCF